MAQDPICGMTVDETKALRTERNGQNFYFCSEHCRKTFLTQAPANSASGASSRPVGLHFARTPRSRFGIKLEGSPRHADVLICTGPVTLQSRDRLKRIYEQMPDPKFVVAVGSCATSGGAFQGCYNVVGHIDEVIPVSAYIPGCPPRPEAIIDGIVKLLTSLQAPPPAPVKAETKGESA